MSTPSATVTPNPTPAPRAAWRGAAAKGGAAIAVVAAFVFGANAVTNGDSSSTTASAGAPAGQLASGGAPGTPPDMGTEVTGAPLTKLTSVATAEYPGTVERATQLDDGSYVVHVVQSNGDGEVHVLVSKDYEVTGTEQGPSAGAPPSGQAPAASSASSSSS